MDLKQRGGLDALTEDMLATDRREHERRMGGRRRTEAEQLEATLAIAEHARNQLQGKLDGIESYMTNRFARLALEPRTPENIARIDELKLLLRRIQGRA